MSDAVVIRGLTKTFGSKVAVRNLDLVVPAGQVTGFIGPNGAGKTTTIRMIMSIIFPDKGELTVLGKRSAVESKDRIGYLPEERGLYRKMKVGAFLNFVGRLKGLGPGLDASVRTWLDRVGLKDVYKKKCEELSKGMQQKVQFIAAVLHQPELIILDEPFSGLDPVNRRLLRELIDEQHKAGRTVIFSTHAMSEAEQLCDRLFMIHQGNKVLDLPMQAVWERFDPRVVLLEPIADAGEADGAALGTIAGVSGVERLDAPRRFELRLDDRADPQAVLARSLALVPARRVEIKRPSLDDVFISLVGAPKGGGGHPADTAALASTLEGGD
jgi:ABC-2 type transport system ATP-binding protein